MHKQLENMVYNYTVRIAFDLDSTLIQNDFPGESLTFWGKLLGLKRKRLRKGIKYVAEFIYANDWELWVYTSSLSSRWQVRRLFMQHGLRLDGIVFQQRLPMIQNGKCLLNGTELGYSFKTGLDILIGKEPNDMKKEAQCGLQMICLDDKEERWEAQLIQELMALT